MSDYTHDIVERIAEQYVAFLAGEASEPQLDSLAEPLRGAAERVCAALRATWHLGELDPPLNQDPLAISLGLIPDPVSPLNGKALKQARQLSRLNVSDIAGRLRARGWETQTAEVFSWERQAAAEVPPAIVAALADELGVTPSRLVGTPLPVPPAVAAVTGTSRFADLARRWAAALGLGNEADGALALRRLMLAGVVRRGAEIDAESWLTALEALVATREHGISGR